MCINYKIMLTQDWMNSKLQKRIHRHPDQYNSYSADKIKSKLPVSQSWRSIKRRSAFDERNKSPNRYERSTSQQDTVHKYTQKRSKNSGYISHLFSILRKNPQNKQSGVQKTEENSSASELKTELNCLQFSGDSRMAPGKIRANSKSTKKRVNLNSLSKQKSESNQSTNPISITAQSNVSAKQMKDYAKFIQSKTSYCTQVNYKYLRDLQKVQSFGALDIKQYKIIESLILCLIDVFNGDQPSSENLIMEYCSLYFQNQQRRKFEVVVNHHIFKSFAQKIKSIYAYSRMWFYLIFKLAEFNIIFVEPVTALLLNGCKLIDRLLKSLFQAVTEALSRSTASVLQAFKSLKTVKQIQKILAQFQNLMQKLEKLLNLQSGSILTQNKEFYSQITQILTTLRPFFIESSFYQQQQYLSRTQIILSWKYLKIPPVPYLFQKPKEVKKYTLVMGLNKVIILYNSSTRILKYRPYMDTFLSRLKQSFEIIIFSDFDKPLTDKIVKQIERQENFFAARLYRSHMSFKNGRIIKDLSKLGRNLSQTILFDNQLPFLGQFPDNQLAVSQFKPATTTTTLQKQKTLMIAINKLAAIQKQYPADIRKILQKAAELYHIPEAASIEEHTISVSQSGSIMKKQRQ